jgi:hypothetical protein
MEGEFGLTWRDTQKKRTSGRERNKRNPMKIVEKIEQKEQSQ